MEFNKLIYERGMMPWQQFLGWLATTANDFEKVAVYGQHRKITAYYYNVPAAFDIETSSFRIPLDDGTKVKAGTMYIWQFGIYGKVCFGKTWSEFLQFINMVKLIMRLNSETRLCIYVHNLQFEFQWIRKLFKWDKVFLLEKRVPVTALSDGIEFRCSMKLAGGVSLATVGKNLVDYTIRKLEGDLDYNLIRGPETPLTEQELAYCENDIRVLMAYIMEKIHTDGDITKIPLTNTGYVRRYCRTACFQAV